MTAACSCGCATAWTLQTHQRPNRKFGDDRPARVDVNRPAPTFTGDARKWCWVPPGRPHDESIRVR